LKISTKQFGVLRLTIAINTCLFILSPGSAFAVGLTGQVTIAAGLDRETLDTYTLTIEVRDSGTPSLTGTVTVSVQVTGESLKHGVGVC